jgi:hypothetical protein
MKRFATKPMIECLLTPKEKREIMENMESPSLIQNRMSKLFIQLFRKAEPSRSLPYVGNFHMVRCQGKTVYPQKKEDQIFAQF